MLGFVSQPPLVAGARLTLLDSCLSCIPSYYMAMFLLNKTFIGKMDKHRRRFFGLGKRRKKPIAW
jgi:hypothetical protein